MKKKIILLLALTTILTGCGKVPKLENGKDAIVSFENGDMISVDDLYSSLKDKYALSILLNMIDKKVLEETFPDNMEKAKKSTESYVSALKENYKTDDELLSAIQQYYGFTSIDEYKDQIYLSYMQSYAIEAYAKEKVTDSEINSYYKNMNPEIEISHILITPSVKDGMTDDEKKASETAAETKAKSILEELKDDVKEGKSVTEAFTELAKTYSEDDATKDKGGSLGKIDENTLGSNYTNLVTEAYKLKDNEYSANVIKTELGYHIVMRSKTYDKKELKDVKDEIIETLAKEKVDNDKTISLNALQHYRKEKGVKIEDDTLNMQYSNYISNTLASLTQKDSSK